MTFSDAMMRSPSLLDIQTLPYGLLIHCHSFNYLVPDLMRILRKAWQRQGESLVSALLHLLRISSSLSIIQPGKRTARTSGPWVGLYRYTTRQNTQELLRRNQHDPCGHPGDWLTPCYPQT